MNRDDIIRLMQEVDPEMIINLQDHGGNMEDFTGKDPKLLQFWPFKNYVKFAALVAAEKDKEIKRLQDMLYEQLGELTALRAEKQMRTRIEQLKEQPQ